MHNSPQQVLNARGVSFNCAMAFRRPHRNLDLVTSQPRHTCCPCLRNACSDYSSSRASTPPSQCSMIAKGQDGLERCDSICCPFVPWRGCKGFCKRSGRLVYCISARTTKPNHARQEGLTWAIDCSNSHVSYSAGVSAAVDGIFQYEANVCQHLRAQHSSPTHARPLAINAQSRRLALAWIRPEDMTGW